MGDYFVNILEVLRTWNTGGSRRLENGTELICHTPHIAPQAWLHIIYSGLEDEEIKEFQCRFPIPFPNEYKEFLKIANGINIFSDSLSIWGLRKNYERKGDLSIQPYDLLTLNDERPKDCPPMWLFFGSYSWDGTRMIFDLGQGVDNNEVYRCNRRSTQIIQEWPSLSSWLTDEVRRLGKLFDANGIKYEKKAPTIPV